MDAGKELISKKMRAKHSFEKVKEKSNTWKKQVLKFSFLIHALSFQGSPGGILSSGAVIPASATWWCWVCLF